MMTKVKKVPYYTMERSVFKGKVWKEHCGSLGAVPIDTPQKLSYDRLAPGTKAPPKPPKPKLTKEQINTQKAEEARQKSLAELQKKQPTPKQKQPEPPQTKPKEIEAEEKAKLPPFDLQDIPSAMDKLGWPVAAKIAKKWFASPAHIYNDQTDSLQPLDDITVTLNWALKHGNVKDRLNELLSADIYSENAQKILKRKILQHVTKAFTGTKNTNPPLSFETSVLNSDVRQFHLDWQFQQKKVSTFDTLDGSVLSDLSGALGNFVLYAAIGRVEITSERYFKYDKKPPEYCLDSVAKLTHVYVYIKDNYSFNDQDSSNSQYLGHWNKSNMVSSYKLGANELLGQINKKWKMKMEGEKIVNEEITWDYLPNNKETDKPIDARRSLFIKYVKKDVYWPVYNRSYNEWRNKHKRGGDFMIYSKLQLYKLGKPIVIKLETVCRPYDNTSTNR